jgi:hypothetical protein
MHQGGGVVRGNQQAIRLVLDDLGRASLARGNHRETSGHALHDDPSEGLWDHRGVHQHIQSRELRSHVLAEPGEGDAIGDAKPCCQSWEGCSIGGVVSE